MRVDLPHEQVCRVAGLVGDTAALGSAVTTALCGHWEHDGPCRWPHHTTTADDGDQVVATVHFDASPAELEHVRRLISAAMETGRLVGPNGQTTRWRPAS